MLLTPIDTRKVETTTPAQLGTLEASGGPSQEGAQTGQRAIPLGIAILCLVLVALALRPGIVSIGPIRPDMIAAFGLSHTQASLLTVVSYLVGATGPLMTGFLRDANGSFEAPLWLLVAVSAAMLATTPFLEPHHHRLAAAAGRARVDPNNEGEPK